MENNKISSESLHHVNSLIKKIEWICKSIEEWLAMCLEVNSQSAGSYSVTVADKMSTEFVDVIVLNIMKIRNHLTDLKKALPKWFLSNLNDVENILSGLRTTSDTLNAFLLENNFFFNNFQMPVKEIQSAIEAIMEEVEKVQVYNQ